MLSEPALFSVCWSALCETSYFIFLLLLCMRLHVFPLLSLPYVRPLHFYFWHHVILFIYKEDNTSGSFCLSHLLHLLSMIFESGALCKGVYLYTAILCTDAVTVYMCPCMVLVIGHVLYYWLYIEYEYLYVYCKITGNFCYCSYLIIISLQIPCSLREFCNHLSAV